MGGNDRDLVLAGAGADDVHQTAHDIFILEAFDELAVELIRHGIAAL